MDVDVLLGLAALVFVVLLVLSAAVESILEALRGLFGKKFPSLRGAVSLDEALAQATALAPLGGELEAKFAALKSAAAAVPVQAAKVQNVLDQQFAQVNSIIGSAARVADLPPPKAVTLTDALNGAADAITGAISDYERNRIWMLRIASGVIGVLLCWATGLDVVDIAGDTLAASGTKLGLLENGNGFGEFVTGISAASGSSYWHDKLDKVRSLKNINQQIAGLIKS